MGRTSTFTQEKADAICERISQGEPLAQICRDEAMPSLRTAYDWMDADAEFAACFARARLKGFDAIADYCVEIADDARNDYMTQAGEEVGRAYDAEHVQRSKLRIETRLKLLAKWDPKRYGEKLEIDQRTTITDLTDEQLDAKLAQLAAAAAEA